MIFGEVSVVVAAATDCALFVLLSMEMEHSSLEQGGFAGFGWKWGCAAAKAQGKGSVIEGKTGFSCREHSSKGTAGLRQTQEMSGV